MANYVRGSGLSWEGYLQKQAFVDDITSGIRSAHDDLAFELRDVADGIAGLQADFNWAMGQLIDRVETHIMLQEQSNRLLQGIFSEVSKYDDEKKIRGYMEQGLKNYNAGAEFMPDALTYFHKAEELIPANDLPFLLYKLGQIYMYDPESLDLDKAQTYFANAGKYYRRDQENKRGGESYLHAGMAAYLRHDDANAPKFARLAADLHPGLLEAFYNQAKFLAAQSKSDGLPALEQAIRQDRNYLVKAQEDGDFGNVSDQLHGLVDQLRLEAKANCDTLYLDMKDDPNIAEYQRNSPEQFVQWKSLFDRADKLYKRDTYFDYLDCLPILNQCHPFYEECQKYLLEKPHAKTQCDKIYIKMKNDPNIAEYERNSPQQFRQWKSLFDRADKLYKRDTYFDFLECLPILTECEPLFMECQNYLEKFPLILAEIDELLAEFQNDLKSKMQIFLSDDDIYKIELKLNHASGLKETASYFDLIELIKMLKETQVKLKETLYNEEMRRWAEFDHKKTEEKKARQKAEEQRKFFDQLAEWRAEGKCTVCGKEISFFGKLLGYVRCKNHR